MALPLWLLKALSPCFRLSRTRLYACVILLPVVILSLALIVNGAVFWKVAHVTATGIALGSAGIALFVLAANFRVWTHFKPRVPDEWDVDRVSISSLLEQHPATGSSAKRRGRVGASSSPPFAFDAASTDDFWEENRDSGGAEPVAPLAADDDDDENNVDCNDAEKMGAPRRRRRSRSQTLFRSRRGAPRPPERPDLHANDGSWFKDSSGRSVLLRGVNATACCKLPACVVPDDGSERYLSGQTWRDVTFVGRPFPLDEADVHLLRMRSWGLTFLRVLFTWEAVEHAGPGVYDEEYLSYLVSLCRRCREYGMSLFLDCHQDCWSRFTGGSGAPAWTLIEVGFNLDALEESGAAFTDRGLYSAEGGGGGPGPSPSGEGIPRMAWNSNNARAAAGTMWTLFFAGNDFAPRTTIHGTPAQEYLQSKFCAMLGRVAEAVKDEPNVVGFDVMNEPSVGFVRIRDVRDISGNQFYVGWRVDAWSAIKLAAGYTCEVDYFGKFMTWTGRRTLNPRGVTAWKTMDSIGGGAGTGTRRGGLGSAVGADSCIWRKNGLWDLDPDGVTPVLLNPAYFATNPRTGADIDFANDYAVPFYDRAGRAIRKHMPDALLFVEPVLDMYDPGGIKEAHPRLTQEQAGPRGSVWAKHFYDGMTLLNANFSRWLNVNPVHQTPLVGLGNIRRSFGRSLARFKDEARNLGPRGGPVLVGECGVPFNMVSNHDFCDMSPCTAGLDTTLRAVEIGLVSATVWTYCPINTHKRGDDWNGEDLSLWSLDDVTDPDDLHSGGRSLIAAVRPYAARTAGIPTKMTFDPYRKDRRFVFTFRADATLDTNETVVFLPRYQYPHGAIVKVEEGRGEYEIDWPEQTLTYRHERDGVHTLVVTKIQQN